MSPSPGVEGPFADMMRPFSENEVRGKLLRVGGGRCPSRVAVFRSAVRALVLAHRRFQIFRNLTADAIAVAKTEFSTDPMAVAKTLSRRAEPCDSMGGRVNLMG